MLPDYSFIIPVYNRPEEVRELLESMKNLEFSRDFEIVIIEDGSTISSEDIVKEFSSVLNLNYFYKSNSGPGNSRNFGMQKASGNYFLILDSDVLLPPNYLKKVDAFLNEEYVDCFGGPDASHPSFSNVQKAINYAMTSFLTTGGIRGNKKVKNFQPRSFNMGLSKKAFEASGGFGRIHPGEDPDLSLRLSNLGFKTAFLPDAYVYHKRRINWYKFYIQVTKFGKVRPILNSWHPQSAKITYWFPTLFMASFFFSLILLLLGIPVFLYLFLLYFAVILIDAAIKNKSLNIGFLGIMAVFIQFLGYGTGFLKSIWKIKFLKQQPEMAFPKLFF